MGVGTTEAEGGTGTTDAEGEAGTTDAEGKAGTMKAERGAGLTDVRDTHHLQQEIRLHDVTVAQEMKSIM